MGLFDNIAARPSQAAPAAKSGGYDFIEIPTAGGAVQRLTKSQFESQPLQERIRVLIQGTASFFRDGRLVPSTQALKSDC